MKLFEFLAVISAVVTSVAAQVPPSAPTLLPTSAPTPLPTTVPTSVPTTTPVPECHEEIDGNLEVQYRPYLDGVNTGVVFNQNGDASFEIAVLVPVQYSEAKVSFRGATDPTGGFDTKDLAANVYWNKSFDAFDDACNTVYTARIPWDLFRNALGGVESENFIYQKVYTTEIVIVSEKTLVVTPNTLLELRDSPEFSPTTLLELDGRQYTRNVTTKIPFKVTFQTEIAFLDSMAISSKALRVSAAVLESSVFTVNPEVVPFGTAELVVVTLVPSPLILGGADIAVNNPNLANNLAISEIVDQRECDPLQEICTQFWRVHVQPHQCTLDGVFTATVHAECHAENCTHPSPDTTDIVMTISSDNFCGVVQEVNIEGSLTVNSTDCNGPLTATVDVWNAEGATIVATEVLEVIASPTLDGDTDIVIYNATTNLLNYAEVLSRGNQTNFSFDWEGATLRCDVNAGIEVLVAVEFDTTRDLGVLSARRKVVSIGGGGHGGRRQQALLNTDDTVRLRSDVDIVTATDSNGNVASGEQSGASSLHAAPLFMILFVVLATTIFARADYLNP